LPANIGVDHLKRTAGMRSKTVASDPPIATHTSIVIRPTQGIFASEASRSKYCLQIFTVPHDLLGQLRGHASPRERSAQCGPHRVEVDDATLAVGRGDETCFVVQIRPKFRAGLRRAGR